MDITAAQVKNAIQRNGITSIDHHDCSICGYMCRYVIRESGNVFFDPGCYCTEGQYRDASYQDIANWYNMQSNDDVRARIGKAIGLDGLESD